MENSFFMWRKKKQLERESGEKSEIARRAGEVKNTIKYLFMQTLSRDEVGARKVFRCASLLRPHPFYVVFERGEPLIQIQLVLWFVVAVNSCLEEIVAICFIIFFAFFSTLLSYSHHRLAIFLHKTCRKASSFVICIRENLSTKALVNLSLYDNMCCCRAEVYGAWWLEHFALPFLLVHKTNMSKKRRSSFSLSWIAFALFCEKKDVYFGKDFTRKGSGRC